MRRVAEMRSSSGTAAHDTRSAAARLRSGEGDEGGVMGQYVEVRRLRTWYDEAGDGDPLLLLHGGMCTNETWGAAAPGAGRALPRVRDGASGPRPHAGRGRAAALPGHGRRHDRLPRHRRRRARPRRRLERRRHHRPAGRDPASRPRAQARRHRHQLRHRRAGAGVEEMLAGMDAGRRRRGDVPRRLRRRLARRCRPLARVLRQVHRDGAPASRTSRSRTSAGSRRARWSLVGDDDMVSLEHTIALFRAIPDAELAVVPGTSHAVMLEKPALAQRAGARLPRARRGTDHAAVAASGRRSHGLTRRRARRIVERDGRRLRRSAHDPSASSRYTTVSATGTQR